jgi:outer membrane protein
MLRIMYGLTALCLLAATPVAAEDFEAELALAVTNSPVLSAERSRVNAVRQSLPSAWAEALPQITVDAAAVAQDSSEERLAFNIRDQPEYWVATVRVSTLLFGGGRVWASTRQARAQVISAIALYQDAVQTFAEQFSEAYASVRFARERMDAVEDNLANLEEQLRFARANQREGFLTRTDVAQAEARVALAQAELARARADLTQANELYVRIAGHQPGELSAPGAVVGLPGALSEALEIAAEDHPALVSAAANVEAAEAAVDVAGANGRMRVFLESSNSTYDAFDPSEFTPQYDTSVTVRATIPLFTGGATLARERQQRHLHRAARSEEREVQRRVHERVNVAWASLEAARARLLASRARLEAAELASRGVRREQQFGQRSMIDVLNQEQERLEARVALAEAERDVVIAERRLASATGLIRSIFGLDRMERRVRPVEHVSSDDDER